MPRLAPVTRTVRLVMVRSFIIDERRSSVLHELTIPFTKAHGAGNDFLLSPWTVAVGDLPAIARAICDRHTGIGADGWMLVDHTPAQDRDATIRLFNADGSEPELSGNGTRCA